MADTSFIRVKVETRDKLLRMAREDNTSISNLLKAAVDAQYDQRSTKQEDEAKSFFNFDEIEDQRSG